MAEEHSTGERRRVIRIWRTRFDPARLEALLTFAREESVPMFRSHDGFEGVAMGQEGDEFVVITTWRDRRAAEALETSPAYQTTAARLGSAGILRSGQRVSLYEERGAWGP